MNTPNMSAITEAKTIEPLKGIKASEREGTSEDVKTSGFVPRNVQLKRVFELIEHGTVETLSEAEKQTIASLHGRYVKGLNIDETVELTFGTVKKDGECSLKYGGKEEKPVKSHVVLTPLFQWESDVRNFVKKYIGGLTREVKNADGTTTTEKWFEVVTVPLPREFAQWLSDYRAEKSDKK